VKTRLDFVRVEIVAVLVLAGAASAGGASAAPVPISVQKKIAALSASPVYMPTWVPLGFIFIGWKQAAPPNNGTGNGSTVYGQGFTITFAHSGRVLLWRLDPPPYNLCVPRPFYDQRREVNGRTVYYSNGNHGDSAYFCVGKVAFTTWSDHQFSINATIRIAASAQRVR
jgi:hypothetical protein